MTQLQCIRSHLTTQPGLCDDCLSKTLGIHPRQTVNAQCRKAGSGVRRTYSVCSGCKAEKLANDLGDAPIATMPPSSFKRSSKPSRPSHHYSREDDLRQRLNNSLCEALNLPKQDYYERLNLERLLLLKGCLARVHDVITLMLTQVLVKWVSRRFGLTSEQITALQTKVDEQHPNASGFDLDSPDLNLVAEVKGNIPVNRRKSFGSAQLKV